MSQRKEVANAGRTRHCYASTIQTSTLKRERGDICHRPGGSVLEPATSDGQTLVQARRRVGSWHRLPGQAHGRSLQAEAPPAGRRD